MLTDEHDAEAARESDNARGAASAPAGPDAATRSSGSGRVEGEPLRSLARVERLLREIHAMLDAGVRDQEHHSFSLSLLVGSILQVVVAGLIALALLDWIFGAPSDALLLKLAFAAVLQLCALTAFAVSRP